MKILLATGIYPPEIGGPASFTRGLARELKRLGHEPVVLAYGDSNILKDEGWEVNAVAQNGGWLARYTRYAFKAWRLAKKSDVVFLQGPVSEGFPGTVGAWLARKPTIMKVVGDYAWEIYRQTPGNDEVLDDFIKHRHAGGIGMRERFERWSSRRARRIIVPSRYLKKIVEAWGVSPEKISLIYNTTQPLPVTDDRDTLRRRYIAEGKKVLVYIGRCVPWKHIDSIIEILPELPGEFGLVVGGDGPCLGKWKELAENIGVAERVRFLGRLDRQQVAEWYRLGDAFVLPSSYEGFPHVVAEAASVGLPCLVSDRGGNPETEELFPRLVTVLPFLDKAAWKKALANLPPRSAPVFSRSFEEATQDYIHVLETASK